MFYELILFRMLRKIQVLEKQLHVQNMHITTRKRAGSRLWCVPIHFELVLLISWSRMLLKLRFPSMEGTFCTFFWVLNTVSCRLKSLLENVIANFFLHRTLNFLSLPLDLQYFWLELYCWKRISSLLVSYSFFFLLKLTSTASLIMPFINCMC